MTFKLHKPTIFTVAALFLFALILRLWGVWHGLPYIYSVDEPALVHSVLGLRFDLNPHHFDWPHFHFYFSYLVFGIFYKARIAWQVWGLRPAMEAAWPILWNDGAIFYLLLRLLSVFMGALTAIPVYLASREIFTDKRKAFLAAFVFALIPFHVENSKYALIDVPATFWAAWSFWLALLAFRLPSVKTYVLAGVFAGLAASSKYNAVLIFLVLVLVHAARLPWGKFNRSNMTYRSYRTYIEGLLTGWYKLALAGVACVTAFFAGTPFALLDFKTFSDANSSRGALWQLSRAGNRFEAAALGRLADSLINKIGVGFGYFATAVALVGIIVALRSKNRILQVVAVFSIIFYLYVGSSMFAPVQIFMPLYLALVPMFVVGSTFLLKLIRQELVSSVASWRFIFPLTLVLLVFPSFVSALQINYVYTQPDTRNLAKQFIDSAIPKGKTIGLEGEYQPFYEGGYKILGVPAWRYEPISESKIEYVVVTGPSHVRDIREDQKYGGILQNINPVYVMLNGNDRLGPNIFIYKIDYPLANQWWLNESLVPEFSLKNILSDDHSWREKVLPAGFTSEVMVTGTWDFTGQITQIMKTKNDFGYPTDKIDDTLREPSITVATLLTPMADSAILSFTNSGIDQVNLPSGLEFNESKKILAKEKISPISKDDISTQIVNDVSFAFVNFSQADSKAVINERVGKAKAEKNQVVVATFMFLPSRELAYAAVDAGADIVLGTSDRIGKVEVYKNKIIVYGLGRFVNSDPRPWINQDLLGGGMLGKFYFFKDRLVDAEFRAVSPNSFDYLTGLDPRTFEISDWKWQQDLRKELGL